MLRQTRFLPMLLQQTVRQTMEGAHPKSVTRHLQQVFQTGAHFTRRFIGKGHRHDCKRRDVFDVQQPGDTVHQNTGFTRTGTRKY